MLGKCVMTLVTSPSLVYFYCFRFDKKVGDAVAADEVVMEIETDKTTVGVPSPGNQSKLSLLSFSNTFCIF